MQITQTERYVFISKDSRKYDNLFCMGFDLDSTLICTKSGKRFGESKNDWRLKYSTSIKTLEYLVTKKSYENKNCVIFIMTNQLGVKTNKISIADLTEKLTNIINCISDNLKKNAVDVSIHAFASIEDDMFRKPRIESLEILKAKCCVDKHSKLDGIYVGDACNSEYSWSDIDYKFALNAGLDFYSDYEFFGNHQQKFNSGNHYCKLPEKVLTQRDSNSLSSSIEIKYNEIVECVCNGNNKLVIMCGSPASGKSTLVKTIISLLTLENSAKIISQDELKTKAKCKKQVKEHIRDKVQYIFIDNCNRDFKTRKEWIDLAIENEYHPIIIYLSTNKDLANHTNIYRMLKSGNKKIPKIAISTFFSKLQEPSEEEAKVIKLESKEILESVSSSSAADFKLLHSYLI